MYPMGLLTCNCHTLNTHKTNRGIVFILSNIAEANFQD
mgnify:FL=1